MESLGFFIFILLNIGGYKYGQHIYTPARNHFFLYIIGFILMSIGGIGFIIGLLNGPAKIEREKKEAIEEDLRRQWEAQVKNDLKAKEQDKKFKNKQETVVEQYAQERLIGFISEIVSYVSQLSSDKNNRNLLLAMNDVIDRLAKDSEIKSIHYQNSFVKKDLEMIMSKFDELGLADEMVVKRLRNLIDYNI